MTVRLLYDFSCCGKIFKKRSILRKEELNLPWVCGYRQHSVKIRQQEREAAAHTALELDTEHSSHSLLFIRLEMQTHWTGLSSLETFS